jgi:hypothetical protein
MLDEKNFKALMTACELVGYAKSAEDIVKLPDNQDAMISIRCGWLKGLVNKANAAGDEIFFVLDTNPKTG